LYSGLKHHSIQKLSVKETAESLDLNQSTVKTRLHRARKLVQDRLNKHIDGADLHIFEFADQQCDSIVASVLNKIDGGNKFESRDASVH